MPKLFSDAELRDHVSGLARAWHLARKALFVGWRTLQQDATIEGQLIDGETDPDGDTCFNILVHPNLNVHCEVDPATLGALRPKLLALEVGRLTWVRGVCAADLGHGTLEIHPVTDVGQR